MSVLLDVFFNSRVGAQSPQAPFSTNSLTSLTLSLVISAFDCPPPKIGAVSRTSATIIWDDLGVNKTGEVLYDLPVNDESGSASHLGFLTLSVLILSFYLPTSSSFNPPAFLPLKFP